MSVRVVSYDKDRCEVDIRTRLASGANYREKRVLAGSRTNARRWGQERERHLLLHGPPAKGKEVPTVSDFQERFLNDYCRANRQKPSGLNQKKTALRVHVVPLLGTRRLNAITTADVQRLKDLMHSRSPKTVNNALTVLSKMLKVAIEWGVLDAMPCTIKLLKPGEGLIHFWDFQEYERLVNAAAGLASGVHVAVLLGGDAGLRAGEIRALEWTDLDLHARKIYVARSEWRGEIGTTKGNRMRTVPMTRRLGEALRQHRHLRGPRVLCDEHGNPIKANGLSYWIERATRAAGLATMRKPKKAGPHVLRHTFCSHLAMRGAPVRVIQELAGHRHLTTTLRYMHLSPGAAETAIGLLEEPAPHVSRGAEREAAAAQITK